MDCDRELHEDAYERSDGEEAYLGLGAVLDRGGDGDVETIYGIRVDADDTDDDYGVEDEDEDESGGFDDFEPDADELAAEDDFGTENEDELDDGAGGGGGSGTVFLDASDDAGGRFSSILQNIITAQADAASAGADSDSAATNALNRILGALRAASRPRPGFGRIVDIRARPDVRDNESNDDDNIPSNIHERRKWIQSWWKKAHTEPQPAGVALLTSGEFGRVGRRRFMKPAGAYNFARMLRERILNAGLMPKQDLCEFMVPNSDGTEVSTYPASVYCGQFSADSSFYYVCCKDFNLHVYDMLATRITSTPTGPAQPYYDRSTGHQTAMKVHKSIEGIPEGWTITDSHLSPDNDRLIYSSMSPTVYMVKTLDYDPTQIPIHFGDTGRRSINWGWGDETVVWSCRFSADGNEIIAGGRGKIFVYDLLANRRSVKISAHNDDVNSCCWADQGSNVLISASDDTFIKVWDRRSLGSHPRPSGVLIGHTEGITNVSAKGDGRYVISNGKDQALRLWDLRKMVSDSEYEKVKDISYGLDDFDYRYADNRQQKRPAHPKDCSIMTYRGHTVMRTLIRCHFSPAETTGSRYIYSGSLDGRIHIWSLDGRVVQILDRSGTLPMSFDPSGPEVPRTRGTAGGSCVRDVSWHTREPIMLSAAWGARGTSSVAWHEWKGLTKMGGRLEDWVEKQAAETSAARQRPRRATRMSLLPGSFEDDDDDDGDFYFDDE